MISEAAQEQAALHALGLLDATEAAAFERAQDADAELRALAAELRETAAELARSAGYAVVPPELKARVLAGTAEGDPSPGKVVAGPWGGAWIPWALAALLMICCGVLAASRERLHKEFSALERKTAAVEVAIAQLRAEPPLTPEGGALRQVAFCPLELQPAPETARPRAAVLWDAARREGKLRVTGLPPAGAGKDYQLWVVEAGRKDTVSAGVVTVDAGNTVEVSFAPAADGGKEPAVAFALSVERAGGSPRNEGPILFLGKL